jgi:hypothetical protein
MDREFAWHSFTKPVQEKVDQNSYRAGIMLYYYSKSFFARKDAEVNDPTA